MKHFHQFVQEKRMERELSLRQFCKLAALDPSNWSKIERGLAKNGQSPEILERISTVLNLSEKERDALTDLALIDAMPAELMSEAMSDANVVEKLPIFFRTLRGEKPTADELKLLQNMIEKATQS